MTTNDIHALELEAEQIRRGEKETISLKQLETECELDNETS